MSFRIWIACLNKLNSYPEVLPNSDLPWKFKHVTNIFQLGIFKSTFPHTLLTDLGSSEESGKDWSDLEREAAEADRERNEFEDEYTKQKKGGSGSRYR